MTNAPDRIPFAVPDLTELEIEAVADVLRTGWITTGPVVRQFETEFATQSGAAHAVMVNSGTAALHLALEAVGVGRGDEVVVPTLTFSATAAVVVHLGARPVLVDVGPDHNVSPAEIADAITSRTKAVIPVHFAGLPADGHAIRQAVPSRVAVVADAAHCFPSSRNGTNVGALCDLNCFSFYATKTMTTGEGGAITTSNGEWADRARLMSLHGLDGSAWRRYMSGGSWRYDVIDAGYKYNMTDISAAIGRVQLRRAEQMRRARERIADRYDDAFRSCDRLELPPRLASGLHAHHLYVLKLRVGLEYARDGLIAHLAARNIGTSVHFIPLNLHSFYQSRFGYRSNEFPMAVSLFDRSVSLPAYSRMDDGQQDRVIDAVLGYAEKL